MSVFSNRTGATKVTRYIVKEDREEPRRPSAAPSRYERDRTEVDEVRTIHIPAPEPQYRSSDRRETITIRRSDDDRRESRADAAYYMRGAGEDVSDRELVVSRQSRGGVERERDFEVVKRRDTVYEDEDDVQHYRRTKEYFAPQQPQTIIIRQEPIIIRERARDRSRSRERGTERGSSPSPSRGGREEDFAIIRRSEVDEDRGTVVSKKSRRGEPQEEEYFYEKKVRERLPADGRRRGDRELSPGDSISQVGGKGRKSHRRHSSDDSMVYVRKETVKDGYGSDDSDGHRGRDLAAGALAGVGAAELFRSHNEKEGKAVSSGGGRLVRDAGAGVVGAVAAEAIRRYRSKSRARSRERSENRGGRSRAGSGSRSRSGSRFGGDKLKSFGALGLAAVAIAAGAAIANKKGNDDGGGRGRSRSRSRMRSRSRSRFGRSRSRDSELDSLENDPTATDARNPKKRNQVIAGAGALGAIGAAAIEHFRSKDHPDGNDTGEGGRIRKGIPIVATGLGAAALAGLYEKNKAKNEARAIQRDDYDDRRSRRRSRSRGGRDSYYDDNPRGAQSDPNLVTYGTDPMYGNNYGQGYYGRPNAVPEDNYYQNNSRDMVPAPTEASGYNQRQARDRSVSRARNNRTRSLSSGSDGRSHSRNRGPAEAAVVGGGYGAAKHAKEQRRRRDKENRRDSRNDSRNDSYAPQGYDSARRSTDPYHGNDPYADANAHVDPYGSTAGFAQQHYGAGGFPPPPGAMPQQTGYGSQNMSMPPGPAHSANAPAYAPNDFPGPPQNTSGNYGNYGNTSYQNPYAPREGGNNVSASNPSDAHHSNPDGLNREVTPPVITVQRPSTDTGLQPHSPEKREPRNSFPGSHENTFTSPKQHHRNISPSVGPGENPNERIPDMQGVTSTPTPGNIRRPPSTAAARYSPKPQSDNARNVATSGPSNLSRQTQLPRYEPSIDSASAKAATRAHPEMRETPIQPVEGRPFLQSPDLRPPSDPVVSKNGQESAPTRRFTTPSPDGDPSMPNLVIPEGNTPFHNEATMSVPESVGAAPYPHNSLGEESKPDTPTVNKPVSEHPVNRNSDLHEPANPYANAVRTNHAPSRTQTRSISPPTSDGRDTPRARSINPAEDSEINQPHQTSVNRDATSRDLAPSGSPAPTGPRKSVAFNPVNDYNEAPPIVRTNTDNSTGSPEDSRHRHSDSNRNHDRDGTHRDDKRSRDQDRDIDNRDYRRDERPSTGISSGRDRHGYDAGDDLSDDTPHEYQRRLSRDRTAARETAAARDRDRDRDRDREPRDDPKDSRDRDRASGRRQYRESDRGEDRDRNEDRGNRHRSRRERNRDEESPGSDDTEDLPPRFDKTGNSLDRDSDRVGETEQERIARGLSKILGTLSGGGSSRRSR